MTTPFRHRTRSSVPTATLASILALVALPGCQSRPFNVRSQPHAGVANPFPNVAGRPVTLQELKSHTDRIDRPISIVDVKRVATARVVMADYRALREDFPFLVEGGLTDEQIDRWLLDTAGLIAETQVTHPVQKDARLMTQSPVTLTGPKRTAIRPNSYNRALVYKVFPPGKDPEQAQGTEASSGTTGPATTNDSRPVAMGPSEVEYSRIPLMEAKGTGTETPSRKTHRNGLIPLNEAMHDFHFEKLTSLVFKHAAQRGQTPARRTLPTYAVISLGFDIYFDSAFSNKDAPPPLLSKPGQPLVFSSPAGLLVRRSHLRGSTIHDKNAASDPLGFPRFDSPGIFDFIRDTELLLRRYGITTTEFKKKSGNKTNVELVDMQINTERELVDFGTIRAGASFRGDLYFDGVKAGADNFNPDDGEVLPETDARYVKKPDSELSVLMDKVGTSRFVRPLVRPFWPKGHTIHDNVTILSTLLANKIRRGEAGKKEAQELHCFFLVPHVKKYGFTIKDLGSTESCKDSDGEGNLLTMGIRILRTGNITEIEDVDIPPITEKPRD